MIHEAMIVMFLGMGTVFIVLLALLAMMTLGGRLAGHYLKDEKLVSKPSAPLSDADSCPNDFRIPAIAVAAAIRRLRHRGTRS